MSYIFADAADIKKVLGSVQANISDDDLNRMIASLKGKNIQQLIADGTKKIGASGAAGGAKGGAPKAEEKPKEAAKKVEKKKEPEPKKEDSDDDMGLGGGLFD